jgi:tRNA(Ile)-lysidine synthase
MLRLLLDLSQRQLWPLHLVVGHCDHRVRPDSADNAAHVARCCEALGLPYMQAVADREQGHWAEVRLTVAASMNTGPSGHHQHTVHGVHRAVDRSKC